MYKKVDASLDFVDREKEIIKFWNDNKIFEKSVEKNEGNKEFTFYDGPPTANGKPHIGHVLTRVMKDIIPRYHRVEKHERPPRLLGGYGSPLRYLSRRLYRVGMVGVKDDKRQGFII